MRRIAGLGTLVGLALMLTSRVAMGEEKDTYQPPRVTKKPWYWPFDTGSWSGMGLGGSEKKSPPKADKVEKPKKVKDPIEAPTVSHAAQEKSASMAREQAKFIRRQQVCDRLREIAAESGNTELEKQAQLLEQRSWYVYEQRTVQARMPSLTPLETTASAKKLLQDDSIPSRKTDDRPLRSVSAKPGSTPSREED